MSKLEIKTHQDVIDIALFAKLKGVKWDLRDSPEPVSRTMAYRNCIEIYASYSPSQMFDEILRKCLHNGFNYYQSNFDELKQLVSG